MSEQRLENGPKPMSGPEAAAGNPSSAHEAARFIATVSLSLGALMLSLFGIIERMVTFQKLAVVNEFALLALLPGIATLAFLACARAISWMISYMRFAQWHAVFPEHRLGGNASPYRREQPVPVQADVGRLPDHRCYRATSNTRIAINTVTKNPVAAVFRTPSRVSIS